MLKLIDANAVRQKWIDQSISFNLYNSGTSLKYLNDIYMHCWVRCINNINMLVSGLYTKYICWGQVCGTKQFVFRLQLSRKIALTLIFLVDVYKEYKEKT